MGKWVFGELPPQAVRRDPNEARLFNEEQVGEGEYAGNDALVREILQNAVDARAKDEPVRVRLAIHDAKDAPAAERLAYYFGRLREPLAARRLELDNAGLLHLPCRFLVCEDFGTRGLEGDTELFQDPPLGKSRQDFYWFWRNIGRSAKTGDDLGRWGLGKTVYRAVSRAGCMLGLTIRQSDRKRLLMGQAVLLLHRHGGKEYMPEGYWCGTENASGLPLPINDIQECQQFCQEWRLTRTSQPGLSVVAPYVPAELQATRLRQAVAVHFFARIVRGDLIVEIIGPELGSVTLDKSTIRDVCKQITWDGPKRTKRHVPPPIDFAKHCLGTMPVIASEMLGKEKLPELTDAAFPTETLAKLRQDFAAGALTSVRVRMWLPRRQGSGQEGQLDVYLQRLSDGSRCDTYYIREGMTITKINSQAALRSVQAIVNVEPGPLAKLLGDTEGPAHEDWDTSEERPDREWKTWKGRVKFVRRIVDSLVEVLTPPTTEPDFELLSDFFSIQRPGGRAGGEAGPGTPPPPLTMPPPPEPKWFHVTARTGGFTIGRNSGIPMPKDTGLRVSVAYDLPRGDPLRNWSAFDFKVGHDPSALLPEVQRARVNVLEGNTFFLTHLQEGFRCSVEGFDRHRDLFIRVDEVSSKQETTP